MATFEVEKKGLAEAYRVVSRVVKDIHNVYIKASSKEKSLWLIANEPTHYIKIAVPGATVEKSGVVALKAELFSSTLSMRGSTYRASYDKENARLDIVCGSKNSVYVLDAPKESITRDKEGTVYIPIAAKKVASLREMLKKFVFSTPDTGFTGSALFKNNSEGMSVLYASVNTCAFYETESPISKKEFEVTVPMSLVMDVLSVVSSEAQISITENSFLIESDSIEAVLPTIEDETKGYTEFYQTLKDNKKFLKGKIELRPKELLPILNSVRTTSSGVDLVKVSFNGKKGKFHLESKNGVCSDFFKVVNNTIGNVSIEIPESYLHTTLSTANNSAEAVNLQIGEDKNLYKLTARNDDYSFMSVGPVSS